MYFISPNTDLLQFNLCIEKTTIAVTFFKQYKCFSQTWPNACVLPQFYAVYAFQARCDQELTLQEYQHVRILKFSDLGGNKDWWLAEANGQKGYVPANYLGRMSYA